MKNRKFIARNIQWDKTDDDGLPVEANDLPRDVEVTLEDLQLPPDASVSRVEDELVVYLADCYGFCNFGFVLEEVED